MSAPVRVQLSRAKGWRMPENTVKVDRSTRWGNPWSVAEISAAIEDARGARPSRAEAQGAAVASFAAWLSGGLVCPGGYPATAARRDEILSNIEALRGKNLACWCALNAPCHADVLRALANRPVCEAVR